MHTVVFLVFFSAIADPYPTNRPEHGFPRRQPVHWSVLSRAHSGISHPPPHQVEPFVTKETGPPSSYSTSASASPRSKLSSPAGSAATSRPPRLSASSWRAWPSTVRGSRHLLLDPPQLLERYLDVEIHGCDRSEASLDSCTTHRPFHMLLSLALPFTSKLRAWRFRRLGLRLRDLLGRSSGPTYSRSVGLSQLACYLLLPPPSCSDLLAFSPFVDRL